ncbi:PREDICTED: GPI ethanolamine phosphate transferase 2-like [Papilio polytes]|uniref:GPI ethanolamine phosphate transferase 2-like n=1 Tax=Papilio polytes TaxID=76194 RepID=UPI00067615EF|nr:PREDICTED: GPI ethanolamine phosphate transferase 2-like [Papilio polytes]
MLLFFIFRNRVVMLSWLQHRWTGLWLLMLALGALTLFLYGFFPLKYHSGKFAHMDDLPNFIDGIGIDGQEVYNAGEHSVVLMVIDGLRYDFATEEYMPFVGELLKNKSACIYVSVAEPPTVTMPRIKAMMTGSISTFADVALNFGAPAVRGDSVLRVAASRGRHSVMYGDDTWLRLFPGLWAEHDGTSSFYVTDYTEALLPADVRQHLYLLHVLAAHSAKQGLPTDTEFYKQFQRAEKQFAQYLATGQQSAAKIAKEFYDESLEAMSKYLTETTAEFDLFAINFATVLMYILTAAASCATLYSLQTEIRKPSITHHQPSTVGLLLAFAIMFVIFSIILVISCFITETKSSFCSFSPLWSIAFFAASLVLTIAYFVIKTGVEKVKDTTALKELNAIDYLLIYGTLFHSWSFFGTSFIEEEHMTWYFYWNTLMFFVLVRTVVVIVTYLSKRWSGATETQEKPELEVRMSSVGVSILPQWVLLIALHRYLRTMNQTGDRWLFLPDTADWLNAPENSFYLQAHLLIGTLTTLGICLWNVRYMNNYMYVHSILTILATICILSYRIASDTLESPFLDIKSWDTITIVNIFWAILIIQALYEIVIYAGIFKSCGCNPGTNKFGYNKHKVKTEDYFYEPAEEPWNVDNVKLNLARSLSHIMLNDLMLIVILLMRPHNVIMVPSVFVTSVMISKCLDHKLLDGRTGKGKEVADLIGQSLVHVWIGMVFFFYQGNSNSLASVDLGSGYVGLREYSAVRVALRMGLHAYAAPALAGAALYARLARHSDTWQRYQQSVWRVCNIYALHRIYSVAVYCVVAVTFRHHLFVWSVFSPKLLYDFVATVFTVQALATIAQIVLLTNLTSWVASLRF